VTREEDKHEKNSNEIAAVEAVAAAK